MNITWTNCAEQMPPDHIDVIVKANGYETIHTGSDLKAWLCIEHVQWTEFSEEKWALIWIGTGIDSPVIWARKEIVK